MGFRIVSLLVAVTLLIAIMVTCTVNARKDISRDLQYFGRISVPSQFEVLEETAFTVVLCHKPSGVIYLSTKNTNGGIAVMVDVEGKPLTREYFMESKSSISNESGLW